MSLAGERTYSGFENRLTSLLIADDAGAGTTSRETLPSIQQESNACLTSQFTLPLNSPPLFFFLLASHPERQCPCVCSADAVKPSPSLSLSRPSPFLPHPATATATRSRAISSSTTPLPTLSLHAARGGSSILYSQNPDLAGNMGSDDENADAGGGGGGGGGERLLTESGRPKRSRAAMTRG